MDKPACDGCVRPCGKSVTRSPGAVGGLAVSSSFSSLPTRTTIWSILGDQNDPVFLRAAPNLTTSGSRVASQPVAAVGRADRPPSSKQKDDLRHSTYWLQTGFSGPSCSKIAKSKTGVPDGRYPSEMHRAVWSTGFFLIAGTVDGDGWLHMAHQKIELSREGDRWTLPRATLLRTAWPCWGNTRAKDSRKTPLLYNTSLHVRDGGSSFRARFGVERTRRKPCSPEGSYKEGSEIRTANQNSPWRSEEARLAARNFSRPMSLRSVKRWAATNRQVEWSGPTSLGWLNARPRHRLNFIRQWQVPAHWVDCTIRSRVHVSASTPPRRGMLQVPTLRTRQFPANGWLTMAEDAVDKGGQEFPLIITRGAW